MCGDNSTEKLQVERAAQPRAGRLELNQASPPSSASIASSARFFGSTSYSCTCGPASEKRTRFCSAQRDGMGFQARISGWNSGDAGIRRRATAATSGRWWWAALLGPHAPCRPVRHGVKLSLGSGTPPLTLEPELDDIVPRKQAKEAFAGVALPSAISELLEAVFGSGDRRLDHHWRASGFCKGPNTSGRSSACVRLQNGASREWC